MNDYEFGQHCGIVASRICCVADKYTLKMITPDVFTQEASAIIEKEFNALHAEVAQLRETQRKLQECVACIAIGRITGGYSSVHWQAEMNRHLADPLVASALKEAEAAQNRGSDEA